MRHDEKKLYQVNKLSYNLVMIFVILNTIHAIFILQNMEVNYTIGIFIMVTIFLSMITFLAAVKLQTYSKEWSYITIGIGVFQLVKYFLTPKEIEGRLEVYLTIMILSSVVIIFIGAIISLHRISKRTHYLNNHYVGNEVMQK